MLIIWYLIVNGKKGKNFWYKKTEKLKTNSNNNFKIQKENLHRNLT